MRLGKTLSFDELQMAGQFEGLQKILLSDAYAKHLNKPLAYWALPTDRRLPLAFLGYTLRDLLNTPFVDLLSTAGIGRKKLSSFVQLLTRAAHTDPAELPREVFEIQPDATLSRANGNAVGTDDFDPNNISEVTWAQWRASVIRHGLENEALGRFAPSLQNMTHMIWNTPLGDYTGITLAEIRAMRTHGNKRVHAVLEVFHAIHVLVAGMGTREHLVVRIVPRLIDQVERWIGRALQQPGIPSERELFANFVKPLLEQIRIDATQQIAALTENRLGISGPITSVRQVSRTMGLTRARVYQLLNEINDIMMVRWPMGRHQSHELRERLQAEASSPEQLRNLSQFYAAVDLFYPGNRRGADGPLERAAESLEEDEELAEVS